MIHLVCFDFKVLQNNKNTLSIVKLQNNSPKYKDIHCIVVQNREKVTNPQIWEAGTRECLAFVPDKWLELSDWSLVEGPKRAVNVKIDQSTENLSATFFFW